VGFLDEKIPAPWVHSDEPTLYTLRRLAYELNAPLEIVAGIAPGWADPWSRVQRVHVEKDQRGWPFWLVTEGGFVIDEKEVQLARWAGADRESK
jgi:hypothetical protein